ncbi:MAG: hypothetical protein KAS32_23910 [Candidatus Peribacteraceae bacterium]|nr:hypothetical protein [Candidatus Peribacteraceae bacterium]
MYVIENTRGAWVARSTDYAFTNKLQDAEAFINKKDAEHRCISSFLRVVPINEIMARKL